MYLFTPWKTLQLINYRVWESFIYWIRLCFSLRVYIWNDVFLSWWASSWICSHFPPQWSQRSCQLSVIVSLRPLFECFYPLLLFFCSQWCDWISERIRALWLAEFKNLLEKYLVQWKWTCWPHCDAEHGLKKTWFNGGPGDFLIVFRVLMEAFKGVWGPLFLVVF